MKIFWKIRIFLKAFGVCFFFWFYIREINNNKVRKGTWGCKEEPRQMWAGVRQCSAASCEISACCRVAFVKHSPLRSSQAGTFMSDPSIAMSCSRVSVVGRKTAPQRKEEQPPCSGSLAALHCQNWADCCSWITGWFLISFFLLPCFKKCVRNGAWFFSGTQSHLWLYFVSPGSHHMWWDPRMVCHGAIRTPLVVDVCKLWKV